MKEHTPISSLDNICVDISALLQKAASAFAGERSGLIANQDGIWAITASNCNFLQRSKFGLQCIVK